eukprot:gene10814-18258_t
MGCAWLRQGRGNSGFPRLPRSLRFVAPTSWLRTRMERAEDDTDEVRRKAGFAPTTMVGGVATTYAALSSATKGAYPAAAVAVWFSSVLFFPTVQALCTRRSPLWTVELTIPLLAIATVLFDVATLGVFEMWTWIVVLGDCLLLYKCDARLTASVMGAMCAYAVAKSAEEAFSLG